MTYFMDHEESEVAEEAAAAASSSSFTLDGWGSSGAADSPLLSLGYRLLPISLLFMLIAN
jgi:hypothetical protein